MNKNIFAISMFLINVIWLVVVERVNNYWSEKYKKLNEDWFEDCRKLNGIVNGFYKKRRGGRNEHDT